MLEYLIHLFRVLVLQFLRKNHARVSSSNGHDSQLSPGLPCRRIIEGDRDLLDVLWIFMKLRWRYIVGSGRLDVHVLLHMLICRFAILVAVYLGSPVDLSHNASRVCLRRQGLAEAPKARIGMFDPF